MPRGDGTGPKGKGPKTGRGQGVCRPAQGAGGQQGEGGRKSGRGTGQGKGGGRGGDRKRGSGRGSG